VAAPDERLRVGLLLCDHLDPDAADAAGGDYTVLFPRRFEPHGLDLHVFDATVGDLPASTSDCDAWITSGSRRSATDQEGWIVQLRDLLADLASEERPQAGICFGHQLTALALGGEVQRAAVGWGAGLRAFDVVAAPAWMEDDDGAAPERFALLMSHQDQVVGLPPGAEVVATADYCPVGAYRVAHHVFCLQGHPEFVPGLSRHLTTVRRQVLGDDVADAAIASLDGPADQDRVAGWIARFLRHGASRRGR
jgi:GMP synthase-like glutamine amidotransferase